MSNKKFQPARKKTPANHEEFQPAGKRLQPAKKDSKQAGRDSRQPEQSSSQPRRGISQPGRTWGAKTGGVAQEGTAQEKPREKGEHRAQRARYYLGL